MAMAGLLPHLNELWQELQRTTPFNLSLLVPLIFLSIFVLFSLTRSSSGKFKLPPSPTRLPIIGNLHQLGTLPHRSLLALSKKYGPVMLLHFGQVPTLVISSADMAKEIIKTHDADISSRPRSTAANELFYESQEVVFAPYGEFWRQVRKICVTELLSPKGLPLFQQARVEESAALVSRIQKASHSKSPINMTEMLITGSNNFICRVILGQTFDGEDDNWYGELSKKMMEQLVSFSFGDFIPALKWVDHLRGFITGLKETSGVFDRFYDRLIEEHKTAKRQGKPANKKDFVDVLLQLQSDGIKDFELSKDILKGLLEDMFLGGSYTTATTWQWTLTELVRNPRVMEKVQEEVRRVVGKKAKVDLDDISQMKYMRCVVRETLRLHPPAPLLLPRETTADVKVGGYSVPAKTTIYFNAFAIHRDPKFWDRPEEYYPERFKDSNFDFIGQDFQFIPFGGGRRACPAAFNFGFPTIEHVLANLLYWFDWKLPSGGRELAETLDMTEANGLIVRKKAPLHLVPTPYSP